MRLPRAFLMIALLACGGGGGGPTENNDPTPGNPGGGGSTNTPPPPTASVAMRSSADGYGGESHTFDPQRVTIARNGSVTWSNSSGYSHNVTFSTAGAPASIESHTSGQTTRQFPTAGTFAYSCTNHTGMTGEVVVQ